MGAHEIDGKAFVFLGHPLHAAEPEIQSVQERNRESSAISGPVHEKCVGLEDYGVCGDELPGICSCLLEGKAGAQIFRVVSDEVRKERARIDENALHRTYSCRSA